MKKCTKCLVEKQRSDFYRTKRMKDGLQSRCKDCMATSYKISRDKKKSHYNSVSNKRAKNNTKRIREWKESRGCCKCGEDFGPCLELHHTDPSQKEHNPSDLAAFSFKKFLEDASKCVILCANCHRKVHHKIISL